MKGKKEDKMLRALFRQKLENAEIIPSPEVSTELMRKLRRREFLHFNLTRFNIWYAAGIVVAGAALALFIFSGTGNNEKVMPGSLPVNTIDSSSQMIMRKSGEEKPAENIHEAEKAEIKPETGTGPSSTRSEIIKPENAPSAKIKSGETSGNKSGNSVSTLPRQNIIPGPVVEKEKLQGIVKMADYSIEASVKEGCIPLKVHFKSVTTPADSCLWSFGDGGFSSLAAPEWLYDVPGEYKVTLEVYGPSGIKSLSAIEIKVFPKPEARFEISPENAVLPNDEITFRNFSTNAVKFSWNFGDGSTSSLYEPKYTYKNFGHYDVSLLAISEHGCKDSAVVQNAFSGSGYYIDFPNAFIPNPMGPSSGYYSQKSDESSQVFHPVFNGVSDFQLRIFSRRGILIFESNDINIGWDGYFKGQLSEPGVYVWKVRGNYLNGETFTKMGDVTLLKN